MLSNFQLLSWLRLSYREVKREQEGSTHYLPSRHLPPTSTFKPILMLNHSCTSKLIVLLFVTLTNTWPSQLKKCSATRVGLLIRLCHFGTSYIPGSFLNDSPCFTRLMIKLLTIGSVLDELQCMMTGLIHTVRSGYQCSLQFSLSIKPNSRNVHGNREIRPC